MMAESAASPFPIGIKVRKPKFKALRPHEMSNRKAEFKKVFIPIHRRKPLFEAWKPEPQGKYDIYPLIYDVMKIDIRMNLKTFHVELMTRPDTPDITYLQKSIDFITAFAGGFEPEDAAVILRCDDVYMDGFDMDDVKVLRGEHSARAIGRLCGKGGKTKFAIENATHTRIVIADKKIRILGSAMAIKVARDALCRLILGSPAGKVCSKLRAVTARLAELQ